MMSPVKTDEHYFAFGNYIDEVLLMISGLVDDNSFTSCAVP